MAANKARHDAGNYRRPDPTPAEIREACRALRHSPEYVEVIKVCRGRKRGRDALISYRIEILASHPIDAEWMRELLRGRRRKNRFEE